MANYKGHVTGGIIAYGLLTTVIICLKGRPTPCALIEWLLCAIGGALFPDIDIKSKGQKTFYWLLLGIYLMLVLAGSLEVLAFVSILATVPMIVKHRGIFHRLWFVISVPLLFAFWLSICAPYYASALLLDAFYFIIGAISHLWLDFGFWRMFR